MNEHDRRHRPTERWRSTLAAYARLVRVPNLFTAPPDVILGAAIVTSFGYAVQIETVVGFAVSSVLLYAAGTTLNDYFDTAEDAHDRPERPIPSGRVTRSRALLLGAVLLAGGVGVAGLFGGATAGTVAAVLALAIVLYDGVFKGSLLGFLFMGVSRGLNVLLGTAAVAAPTGLPVRAFLVPAIVTLYVGCITYMAESETGTGDRLAVSVGVGGTVLAGVGVVAASVAAEMSSADTAVMAALLAGFLIWTGPPLRTAYIRPAPETIGPAVGACVLGLTILTAAFAATAGIEWSIAAVVFFLPAVGFSEVFDVS